MGHISILEDKIYFYRSKISEIGDLELTMEEVEEKSNSFSINRLEERRNIRVYSRTVSSQVTDHVHVHTSSNSHEEHDDGTGKRPAHDLCHDGQTAVISDSEWNDCCVSTPERTRTTADPRQGVSLGGP